MGHELLVFVGDHPFLSFFLTCALLSALVRIFRGYPPPGVDE